MARAAAPRFRLYLTGSLTINLLQLGGANAISHAGVDHGRGSNRRRVGILRAAQTEQEKGPEPRALPRPFARRVRSRGAIAGGCPGGDAPGPRPPEGAAG